MSSSHRCRCHGQRALRGESSDRLPAIRTRLSLVPERLFFNLRTPQMMQSLQPPRAQQIPVNRREIGHDSTSKPWSEEVTTLTLCPAKLQIRKQQSDIQTSNATISAKDSSHATTKNVFISADDSMERHSRVKSWVAHVSACSFQTDLTLPSSADVLYDPEKETSQTNSPKVSKSTISLSPVPLQPSPLVPERLAIKKSPALQISSINQINQSHKTTKYEQDISGPIAQTSSFDSLSSKQTRGKVDINISPQQPTKFLYPDYITPPSLRIGSMSSNQINPTSGIRPAFRDSTLISPHSSRSQSTAVSSNSDNKAISTAISCKQQAESDPTAEPSAGPKHTQDPSESTILCSPSSGELSLPPKPTFLPLIPTMRSEEVCPPFSLLLPHTIRRFYIPVKSFVRSHLLLIVLLYPLLLTLWCVYFTFYKAHSGKPHIFCAGRSEAGSSSTAEMDMCNELFRWDWEKLNDVVYLISRKPQ